MLVVCTPRSSPRVLSLRLDFSVHLVLDRPCKRVTLTQKGLDEFRGHVPIASQVNIKAKPTWLILWHQFLLSKPKLPWFLCRLQCELNIIRVGHAARSKASLHSFLAGLPPTSGQSGPCRDRCE